MCRLGRQKKVMCTFGPTKFFGVKIGVSLGRPQIGVRLGLREKIFINFIVSVERAMRPFPNLYIYSSRTNRCRFGPTENL